MAESFARDHSKVSGFSRQPVMLEAQLAPPTRLGINLSSALARCAAAKTQCAAVIWARLTEMTTSSDFFRATVRPTKNSTKLRYCPGLQTNWLWKKSLDGSTVPWNSGLGRSAPAALLEILAVAKCSRS